MQDVDFSQIFNMPAALRDKRGANEVENEWKREVKRGQRDRKRGHQTRGKILGKKGAT